MSDRPRIAIYARVSSADKCPSCKKQGERIGAGMLSCATCGVGFSGKSQDYENQLLQLREHAVQQGWEIVAEFVDRKSGKNGDRDQFKAMFQAAENGEFAVLLVWALDRFTREGIPETFAYIAKLMRVGCQFYSLTEAHFRTTGPCGELMIAIAAWIAKQERIRISERTLAGLATARAKGRFGGRKPKHKPVERIHELRAGGMSLGDIAVQVGLSKATVARVCA